ncbi:MAG: hypothetical protein K0Q72_2064, partial [Armatimonadetes bacterium]|nr:hypothetical protein [Armatimonadota bacterium]
LPDYAVLKYDPEQYNDDFRDHAVLAGFFNERWQP